MAEIYYCMYHFINKFLNHYARGFRFKCEVDVFDKVCDCLLDLMDPLGDRCKNKCDVRLTING